MDLELLYLINNQWTSPALDHIMTIASSASLWLPFLILLVVLVALFGGFRGRALVICTALTLAIGDGLVTQFMKDIFNRPRPHKAVSGVRLLDLEKASPRILAVGQPLRIKYSKAELFPDRGRSFPSGHVVNNISVATVFALLLRWGWLAYFPAALVSYSRIYVGSHWPSDVIVSVFLGIGIAMLCVATVAWAWRKFGEGVMPETYRLNPKLLRST